MIYLDYSATTPVMREVLESYITATKEFMANSNSIHSFGVKSKELLNNATSQISSLFSVSNNEIIYTSGATESNNMALKGIALAYQNLGKRILISKLEHPSIYSICDYLKTLGFIIETIENDSNGLIDFNDLKEKIKKDTILVSICAVNSELGIRQPLKTLRQIIKRENPNTLFHSDMTQGVGKVSVNFHDVDLASISGHKIYGPKGIGLLYKESKVRLVPLIHGSSKEDDLRPGTPPLPLIVSFSKAIRIALSEVSKKEIYVKKLNDKIISNLKNKKDILINSTSYSIPHILNISLLNIKPETFIHALEQHECFVGTNTACASGEESIGIMAVYNDHKRATTSIRISLSHITTNDEVNKFLTYFDSEYEKLNNLM